MTDDRKIFFQRRFAKWIENGFNTATAFDEMEDFVVLNDVTREEAEELVNKTHTIAELIRNTLQECLDDEDFKFEGDYFIDFMTSDENSKEIENIFSNFKKFFYDVKPGYDHALLLTNTENGKTWMSSTNNIEQREEDLKGYLKKREVWYEPWVITFGALGDNILDKIKFDQFKDIGKIPNKKFIDMTIPKNQVENVKEMFIKLTAEYIKINHTSKGKEIRQLIDDHFNSKNNREPIRDLINKIDTSLN